MLMLSEALKVLTHTAFSILCMGERDGCHTPITQAELEEVAAAMVNVVSTTLSRVPVSLMQNKNNASPTTSQQIACFKRHIKIISTANIIHSPHVKQTSKITLQIP